MTRKKDKTQEQSGENAVKPEGILEELNVTTGRAGDLRQRLFPPEFRIPRPAWTPEMVELLRKLQVRESTISPKLDAAAEVDALLHLVADFATGLWRIRNRVAPNGGEPPDELRAVWRHVESTWDALASATIEIRDHTGERYVDGMALKVVAFQPTEGVPRETVSETIKPSIAYKGKLIQKGEVVVATPSRGSSARGNGSR